MLSILENVQGIYQVWDEVMTYINRFSPEYLIGTLNVNVTKLGDVHSRTRVYFFLLRRDVARVRSHHAFQSLLENTLQKIYTEYKGRSCSRKLFYFGQLLNFQGNLSLLGLHSTGHTCSQVLATQERFAFCRGPSSGSSRLQEEGCKRTRWGSS